VAAQDGLELTPADRGAELGGCCKIDLDTLVVNSALLWTEVEMRAARL